MDKYISTPEIVIAVVIACFLSFNVAKMIATDPTASAGLERETGYRLLDHGRVSPEIQREGK